VHNNLLLILGLLFAVFLLVMLAQKLKIAYPIFLVLAGLVISFIPGIPVIRLKPDLVFLIFLPPLLYEAAWYTSWKEFWRWKRPIALLAFGLVIFTSTLVAYFSSNIIPGCTLALGFLLGGIISPPDAVSATTVLKGLEVPKRVLATLEGESLVNDASSLIVVRFALAAILTGTFSFQAAGGQFIIVATMGVVVGILGATVMYAIHRFLPTTPAIDVALTVMTPYILFLTAEQFHFSGVMAVVSGGLFLSYRSHKVFSTATTRINMVGVWSTMTFVMNAVIFILIGLELPEIINGLGEASIGQGIKYGLIISGIIILLRFLWVYPATYIPRWLSAEVRKEPNPGWKSPLIISWAGMRGVVSLATALSIPMLMNDGTPFPLRNLFIFITFVTILVTLVLQGLTLPFIIKLIDLKEIEDIVPEDRQQTEINLRLAYVGLRCLCEKYPLEVQENDLVKLLKENFKHEISNSKKRLSSLDLEGEATQVEKLEDYRKILLDIYAAQRVELFELRKEKNFSDKEIRKAELQLDLNEMKISSAPYLA
jgi:Na+/H+ antiporter